ncbi:type I restriction-modification system subunit M [Allofournierella massiliensis]|uniref:type I restriction-modification system subunit M n=1 Tax=Allofournierella massiliensis TaxID=1650663 RepID=UPI0035694ABE
MAIKKTTFEDIKNALWAGANTFRDNIDASNYKDYVLSMLFVKYLSDTFDESVENLKKEYEGIRLERQIANLPFVLKEEYTFNYLLKNKYAVDIGSKISEALTGIESSNAILSGIFRGIDFNSENNLGKKEQKNPLLRNLLDDFADLDLRPSHIETKDNEVPADVVGDAYEYMIGEFATMAGKKAGSFFTPQQVSEVMAQIVAPQEKDRVYDPTCGSGSLLIRAAKKGGLDKVSIYGQEVNNSAISMARMNMFIHDIKDAHIAWGDTLANPQHLDGDGNLMKFECIVANMPFSKDKWAEGFNPGGEVSVDEDETQSKTNKKGKKKEFKMEPSLDRFHRFDMGVPPASKGDWAFLLHMIHSMSGNGRVAAVAPHGVLFRGASEGKIRQAVIEKNLIDAVIGLPENLFYGTSIPACIVVFKRGRTTTDVLFVDASKGFKKEKAKNKLRDGTNGEPNDIKKIVDTYKAFTNGENAEQDKYSHVASRSEIEENEYNLNIPRYVDTFEEEELIDLESVNKEIADIKGQIAALEKEMEQCMKELGL